MSRLARRKGPSQFERAADGSMTLMEHLRELRSRLFKASLGVLGGLVVGLFFAGRALDVVTAPYCRVHPPPPGQKCGFIAVSPIDPFLLNLRIALYLGLLIAAPIWLYQLWAFIAPGLHKHERRYTYAFAAVAAPLFAAGVTLAFLIVSKTLHFFLSTNPKIDITVGLSGYFDFVTNMMLLFGAGFEFPLIVVMLNFAGILSAKRLLGWWRPAVFLMFVFGAVVTPTPDPFGMSALAASMALLYFGAVGVAFLNDRRRQRRHDAEFGTYADDELSPIDEPEPIEDAAEAGGPAPVSAPLPLDRRYDDST